MRQPAELLLRHGHDQHHLRRFPPWFTDAVYLQATNANAQEADRGKYAQYWYHVRLSCLFTAILKLTVMTRTWIVSIYRQVLLPGLDFTDMTYDGVLVTLLSGVEPAVAIALACLPLLRPLLGRRKLSAKHSGYEYGSNGGSSGLYRKEGLRSGSRPFDPLEDDHDDNDASSEVQLHPIKPVQDTMISASTESKSDRSMTTTTTSNGIAVEKRWEITSVTV